MNLSVERYHMFLDVVFIVGAQVVATIPKFVKGWRSVRMESNAIVSIVLIFILRLLANALSPMIRKLRKSVCVVICLCSRVLMRMGRNTTNQTTNQTASHAHMVQNANSDMHYCLTLKLKA